MSVEEILKIKELEKRDISFIYNKKTFRVVSTTIMAIRF